MKPSKLKIMMLHEKTVYDVWGTIVSLVLLFSSCHLSSVDDEIIINLHPNAPIEIPPIKNVVDTFYHQSSEFLFNNTTLFDKEPRGKFVIKTRGYICDLDSINMLSTLAETVWYMGMERNKDLVQLAFDTLFIKEGCDNKIHRTSFKSSFKLSSDYARIMSIDNRITYNIPISKVLSPPIPGKFSKGMVGFGSWDTEVEFKDMQIQENGRMTSYDVSHCISDSGEWKVMNGVLMQTSRLPRTRAVLPDFVGNKYILQFKARRINGSEGFFLYFGVSEDRKKGYYINVGGWNNSFVIVENLNGAIVSMMLPCHLKNNRWYNAKLISKPEVVEFYMNGNLVFRYKPIATSLQYYSAGYDEQFGEVVIKVVNAANVPYKVRFNLWGNTQIEAKGRAIILAANSDKDENTLESPQCIYPQSKSYNRFGKLFEYKFLPFSYTILRIKAQKR